MSKTYVADRVGRSENFEVAIRHHIHIMARAGIGCEQQLARGQRSEFRDFGQARQNGGVHLAKQPPSRKSIKTRLAHVVSPDPWQVMRRYDPLRARDTGWASQSFPSTTIMTSMRLASAMLGISDGGHCADRVHRACTRGLRLAKH
jgi:hypothetical protein